jgi:hypothetical protein
MAIPAVPTNVVLQQGNSQALVSWDLVTGATSYDVQRSTDNITFVTVGTTSSSQYLDTTVTVGTEYWYQVASVSASGTSGYSTTTPQSIVPTKTADLSLGMLRYFAKKKADMDQSNFLTLDEWNFNLNQSYYELYDLLITLYEDFFLQEPYSFQTDGSDAYDLPDDFYKLMGVDCGLSGSNTSWATLRKFDFIQRNRYVYPQMTSTLTGVYDLQYRLMGNQLHFIPTPQASQSIRVWYIPKLTQLLKDTDICSGISGWTEYIIVDAAIKAKEKEESDVSVLMAQKMQLLKRINDSAMNRDVGQPDTISRVRNFNDGFGGGGFPNGDGSFGGF